jgi:hypothetical protein
MPVILRPTNRNIAKESKPIHSNDSSSLPTTSSQPLLPRPLLVTNVGFSFQ